MAAQHSRAVGIRPFRRALTVTLIALAIACGAFAALGYFQGPRLTDARVDTGAVTTSAAQQLRLFVNQAVADVDAADVTISPSVPFTVSTASDVVTVQFTGRLQNATRYEVRVADVTSPYESVESTLQYAFTTSAAGFYYLDRADPLTAAGEPDRIIRASADGSGDRVTVVSAQAIQSFVVVGRIVVVATLENNQTSALTIVDPLNGSTERLVLPGEGTIDLLRGADAAGIIAFTFTSLNAIDGGAEYEQALFSVDLAGDHVVTPVTGFGDAAIEVLGYDVVLGTSRIIAHTTDTALLDIDLTGTTPPLPLGSYTGLGRIAPDGSQVAVENIFGQFALRIADGTETPLVIDPIDGLQPFGGDVQLLGTGSSRIQQIAVFDDATGRFASYIVDQDDEGQRIVYETTDQKSSLDTFQVSPNGQYIAVTMVPDASASVLDGYVVEPKANTITTVLIDVASGAVLGSVEGFDVQWRAG